MTGTTTEGFSPSREGEAAHELQKYESAIRQLFREYFPSDPEERTPHYGSDFDISDPRITDMDKVQSGQFEIRSFTTSPTQVEGRRSFHFYVGSTEFHLTGKAADRIYELMGGEEAL